MGILFRSYLINTCQLHTSVGDLSIVVYISVQLLQFTWVRVQACNVHKPTYQGNQLVQ